MVGNDKSKDNAITPASPDAKGEAGYKEERKAFFKGLSTSIGNFLALKVGDGLKDLYKAFDDLQGDSFHTAEERAWVLITGSITLALAQTFQQFVETLDEAELDQKETILLENAFKHLGWDMDDERFEIDRDFLEDPSKISLLPRVQENLYGLLNSNGASENVATELSNNFPNQYLMALSSLWGRKRDYFIEIEKRLEPTPASKPLEWIEFWSNYNRTLRKNIKDPLFDTNLNLETAYIDLNAYCETTKSPNVARSPLGSSTPSTLCTDK